MKPKSSGSFRLPDRSRPVWLEKLKEESSTSSWIRLEIRLGAIRDTVPEIWILCASLSPLWRLLEDACNQRALTRIQTSARRLDIIRPLRQRASDKLTGWRGRGAVKYSETYNPHCEVLAVPIARRSETAYIGRRTPKRRKCHACGKKRKEI